MDQNQESIGFIVILIYQFTQLEQKEIIEEIKEPEIPIIKEWVC